MRVSNILLLSSLLIAGACAQSDGSATGAVGGLCTPAADSSPVVTDAGGFTVTEAEWEAELLSIPARARARYENEKAKSDLADRVLLNKALFAKASETDLAGNNTVKIAARMAAEKAYITAFFGRLEEAAASDEAVKSYYEENIDRYSRPMVRLRHILVKDEALAKKLKKQISGGADFAELATLHTIDRSSKSKGGELDWSTQERYVPEFGAAAFALQGVGTVSEPVKTQFGFHIIKLLERREKQPIEEVRSGIERVLVRDSVRDFRNGVRDELGIGKAVRSRPDRARERNRAATGGAPAAAGGSKAAPQPRPVRVAPEKPTGK
ncbi:MAG: peptidyl-prolyl cis-trans isomerase [Myxococcota bacterium]|nr:peptidyl-prolyl cis-trans isomerase [Myxococcota bacterium]